MLKRGANQTINGTVKTTRALANGTTAVAGKVAAGTTAVAGKVAAGTTAVAGKVAAGTTAAAGKVAASSTLFAGKVALTATLAYATLKNNILLFSSAFIVLILQIVGIVITKTTSISFAVAGLFSLFILFFASLFSLIGNFGRGLPVTFSNIFTHIFNPVNSFVILLIQTMMNFFESFQDVIPWIVNTSFAIGNITVSASNYIDKLVNTIYNDVKEGTTKLGGDIAKGTTKLGDDIAKGTTKLGGDIAKGTTKLGDDIAKGTTNFGDDIAKGTTNFGDDIAKGTTKLGDDIDKGVKKFGNDVKEGYASCRNSIVKDINNITGKIEVETMIIYKNTILLFTSVLTFVYLLMINMYGTVSSFTYYIFMAVYFGLFAGYSYLKYHIYLFFTYYITDDF